MSECNTVFTSSGEQAPAKRRRGRPRKNRPTLPEIEKLFLENYESLKEHLFQCHPDLWAGCATEALHRVVLQLPDFKGFSDGFVRWAKKKALKALPKVMYAEPSRAAWLRGLRLDIYTRNSRWWLMSDAARALIRGINSALRDPKFFLEDPATQACDLYQQAIMGIHENVDAWMKPGTADIETRLYGYGRMTVRHYHRTPIQRDWNQFEGNEDRLRENCREVVSKAEWAEVLSNRAAARVVEMAA